MNLKLPIQINITPEQYAAQIVKDGLLQTNQNLKNNLTERVLHPEYHKVSDYLLLHFDKLITGNQFPELPNTPRSGCALIFMNGNYIYQHYDGLDDKKIIDERFFNSKESFIDYVLPLFFSFISNVWGDLQRVPYWITLESIYTPHSGDYQPDLDFYLNFLEAVFNQKENSFLPQIKYPRLEETLPLLIQNKEKILEDYGVVKADSGYQTFYTERGVKSLYKTYEDFEAFIIDRFFSQENSYQFHFTLCRCVHHPYNLLIEPPR